jgi:alpha-tubulin suppressor-like RCC1 family protein
MQLGLKGKKIAAQAELLPLPSHAAAVDIAAGGAHSLVVLEDGRWAVWCGRIEKQFNTDKEFHLYIIYVRGFANVPCL